MDEEKILGLLPFDYEYSIIGEIKHLNEQDFICSLNIRKLYTEEDAKKWIAKLSENTLTTWRVQRTYPESGRYNIYKIAMKCQHNVNHKFKTAQERKKNHISKHTGCPSTLVLTIKRYIKKSKAKQGRQSNPSLIEWPCFVELKFIHNHALNTAEVLRFRPLGNEIKEKIILLFRKGHTASTALESIKLELFLDNDDRYYEIASDRFYVPTLSQVQYLFKNTFDVTGLKDANFVSPSLEELINNYNASNSTGRAEIGIIDDTKFVTICSPIMARAHELLPHSSQIAIIETYGNNDKRSHKLHFIVSPTPAGAIPLGCVITESGNQGALNASLDNLKKCFPCDKSFYGQKYPLVFMTDNDVREQDSLKSHWPNSLILLCQYNVLKSAWYWLNCNHNVPKNMREEIYYSFKNLIYCQSEKELCFLYSSYRTKYGILPKYISYLTNLWPNRLFWSSAFRSNIQIESSDSYNYIDITFKIMKDGIMERIKNYNLTQLVDFILVHYESYIQRRLLDFYDGKVSKRLLYKYIPPTCIINPSMIIPSETDNTCYFVPSESDYSTKYMVDIKHCVCSCENGKSGRLCKHLCGVINQIENPNQNFDVPQDFKDMIHRIATGTESNIPLEEAIPSPCFDNDINFKSDDEKPSVSLTDKENDKLKKFFESINNGLKHKSETFVPAVKAMVKTFSKIKSESSLLTAIKMFGKNIDSSSKIHKTKIIKQNCTSSSKTFRKKNKNRLSKGLHKHFIPIIPRTIINCDPLHDPLAV